MNTTLETPSRKGVKRPHFAKTMKIPTGEFTQKVIMSRFNLAKHKPKPVSVYVALTRLVKAGKLEIVGAKREKGKRGRAQLIYKAIQAAAPLNIQPEQ